MNYVRWILWSLYYLLTPRQRTLDGYLTMATRTRKPWWQWKPGLWHNVEGKQWEICFENEQDFVERRALQVQAHIGQESGRIVGLTIWDEKLKPAAPSGEQA